MTSLSRTLNDLIEGGLTPISRPSWIKEKTRRDFDSDRAWMLYTLEQLEVERVCITDTDYPDWIDEICESPSMEADLKEHDRTINIYRKKLGMKPRHLDDDCVA